MTHFLGTPGLETLSRTNENLAIDQSLPSDGLFPLGSVGVSWFYLYLPQRMLLSITSLVSHPTPRSLSVTHSHSILEFSLCALSLGVSPRFIPLHPTHYMYQSDRLYTTRY